MRTKTSFLNNIEWPDVNPFDKEMTNSGVGFIAEYENFNNLFSPTKGLRVNLTYDQYLEFIGSDRDFGRLLLFANYYQPVVKNRWWQDFVMNRKCQQAMHRFICNHLFRCGEFRQ